MNFDFLKVVFYFFDYFIFYIFVFLLFKRYFITYVNDYFCCKNKKSKFLLGKKIELEEKLKEIKSVFLNEKKYINFILIDFEKWKNEKCVEENFKKLKLQMLSEFNFNKQKALMIKKNRIYELSCLIERFNSEMIIYGNSLSDEYLIKTFFLKRKKNVL